MIITWDPGLVRESERNCFTSQHPTEKKNKTSPHHIDVGQFIIDATKGFIFPKTVDGRHLKSQLKQTLSSRQPRNCGPSFSQLSSPCQSNFFFLESSNLPSPRRLPE